MRSIRPREVAAGLAALGTAILFVSATGPVEGAPPEERSPETERRGCCQPAVGNWQDFVQLEVRDQELVLTNVSDRTIVAWTVRQVTRISRGNEGYGSITVDFADYPLIPDGQEKLLLPGKSVTLERPPDPWIRPDLKGPEYEVYYDVGALVFEEAEWVGVPSFVDRIFEARLEAARSAVTALEVIASGAEGLEDLPERYRWRLQEAGSRSDALRAIEEEARASLEVAVANLRPQDLDKLPQLAEGLR